MRKYIDDILAVLGAGCISTGTFLIHIGAGFIVTGLLLVAAAYIFQAGEGGDYD